MKRKSPENPNRQKVISTKMILLSQLLQIWGNALYVMTMDINTNTYTFTQIYM